MHRNELNIECLSNREKVKSQLMNITKSGIIMDKLFLSVRTIFQLQLNLTCYTNPFKQILQFFNVNTVEEKKQIIYSNDKKKWFNQEASHISQKIDSSYNKDENFTGSAAIIKKPVITTLDKAFLSFIKIYKKNINT